MPAATEFICDKARDRVDRERSRSSQATTILFSILHWIMPFKLSQRRHSFIKQKRSVERCTVFTQWSWCEVLEPALSLSTSELATELRSHGRTRTDTRDTSSSPKQRRQPRQPAYETEHSAKQATVLVARIDIASG